MFQILTYKPDQGRMTRNVAFAFGVCLAYYGCSTLHDFLSWDWARRDLHYTIPVLEVLVTPGLLISIAVFVLSLFALRRLLNHPKLGDLLIDTEGELKRVTWPSWSETWNGSLVVVATVLAMLVILAGADFVLTRFFEHIVF